MTKEAVELQPGWLARDVELATHQTAMLRELGGVAGLIKEIYRLRAAARSAPDAGLVERLQHEIDGYKFFQLMNGPDAAHQAAIWKSMAEDFAKKLDAAEALISTRPVAGEPVAYRWRYITNGDWKVTAYPPTPQPNWPMEIVPLYATPAPSGRDPATIDDEMVERAWAGIVGRDVAAICHQASVVRGDIKSALIAALAAPVVTEER